ncbi:MULTISPECIES: TetR/AcrR family transcriptional regulator [Pseudonocardia]|uniref:Fatty acid metabolism regulator protein n=2 Tax=Pseudonocardia TaxID=1847 RepID=A0A1Y2MWS3_PSEAH|nr:MULTISPECIES: TetR/AcrR family transcriptional regulator [Pseudonocardia]OSY39581.1 Fatty acid metabolism regulator protein [Pseudonocardia autotrophica]TDN72712.1 TetR family transcriptional regulator [Pseudonocardia autotrophica]BBG03427.1 TetR family transcriptional regulator [Pseudonocardia autotrophica]GEC24847.1 TetR family transcriptional regulator [Pseudonocardia saturnea]
MARTAAAKRRDAARERIVESAIELLRETGFRAAQMSLIAVRAGVGVGSIYSHFPSQVELFAEIYQRMVARELEVMRRESEAVETSAMGRLSIAVRVFCERSLSAGPLAFALLFEPAGPAVDEQRLRFREEFRVVLAELVRSATAQGEVPEHDVALSSAAVVGIMTEALVRPLSPDGEKLVGDGLAECVVRMSRAAIFACAEGA